MTTLNSFREQDVHTSQSAPRDHTVIWVGVLAAIVSICTYAYFAWNGMALGYKDSISHLQIAARTLNSPTSGFAQLGGVWLPLPHLLMMPFVWIDSLYYSGFAGSVVSMTSYVVACVYIYKIVFKLTDAKVPAIAGTAVFALCANTLYMQSTPMTELLLFASIAAMTYYLQCWIQKEGDYEHQYPYLFAAGVAATVGCLVRYEAWVMTMVFTGIVLLIAWRRYGRQQAVGITLSYLFIAGFGIVLWMGWNLLIFGNPLNFQNGEYAKPSLWVGEGEKAVGNPVIAAKTYWYAMVENVGLVIVLAMIVGVITLLVFRRRWDILPTLGLFMIAPFFVFALTVGQRPLHVEQITGDLYNVRFGLMMVLPAAIVIGHMISLLPARAWAASLCLVIGVSLLPLMQQGASQIVTVREGSIGFPQTALDASIFLRNHYDGGVVLAESFGSESILFNARIPLSRNVYEGSYLKWDPALSNPPGQQIKWIIMRIGNAPDKTYRELYGTNELDEYKEVFKNDLYLVYKREQA